jgi:endonuclease/exonuclease/phosphatase family metal-dependent hydrolase
MPGFNLRIVSVNAWNSNTDRELRTRQLIDSVKKLEIEILGMQEIDDRWEQELRDGLPDYKFYREENLMIVSLFEMRESAKTVVLGTPIQLVRLKGQIGRIYCSLAIANVHFPRGGEERVERALLRLDRIRHRDTIITGDFNRTKLPKLPEGWEVAVEGATWPSWRANRPPLQLDWMLVRLSQYTVDEVRIMRGLYVSDHLPTMIELELLKN